MYKAALVAMLFGLSACSTVPENPDALKTQLDGPLAQLQLDTRQLQLRLDKLTEDKSCSYDNQCKVIPVGARPCGGPEAYLLYSSAQTDEKMLQYTAERYQQLKRKQNDKLGLVSTCQMLMAPAASCQQSRCVLDQGDVR
ncbi:hypothetical protein [Rheinheimera sp.]|uniref:hypothetical protein n=1 Tax=Rheinheimera sp. TaxID=1869214 RepID=UPI00307DE1DF